MFGSRHLGFTTICILALISGSTLAQEPIRFARTPDISPDGQTVAFSYLGDIWTVSAIGGVARHVTMHEKHDMMPVFSPDGKYLAFSSNRHGTYDVFVSPIQGGRPIRLTFDSADDQVTGWSPDGQFVLFASTRSNDFPHRPELYKVPVQGGRAQRITFSEGREGTFSPRGDQIAYVRGPGTWYRKGYRGSSNDDIWICQADGTNPRQVTNFNGQDNSPMWSPDGHTLYYVSEYHGTPANIVQLSSPGRGAGGDHHSSPLSPLGRGAGGEGNKGEGKTPDLQPKQLTFHKDDAVRRARLSANGQWLIYECGPDLWILNLKDGSNRKLAIEVHADDKSNPEKVTTFTSGATEFALSQDEKNIAFVVHGEIFLIPRTGGKAKRLTDHPAFDHGPAWAPDSKKILFLSDRNGHEDIYVLESDDPDHADLPQAHRFKVRQLTNNPDPELGVSFSPDGKKVSFLRAGKLITMNPDGSDEKAIVKDGTVIDYEWSPDSQWLCYARMDGSFASELFIIPAGGTTAADPPRNVTRFATYNAGVTWSRSGNKLAFISQRRRGIPSAYVLSLQKPAAPGASTSKDIDWEDIHLRVQQPASMTISEAAIANDGSRIAFRGGQDGDDLWVAAADGGQLTRITTGSVRPTQIQWSRLFSTQVYFRDRSGNLKTASTTTLGTTAPTSLPIPFHAKMILREEDTFAEIFEQSWRALNEHFYDPAFHGANWTKVREKYRPLVKHCTMKEDLYVLISLMLGELNASHLGISGNLGSPDQVTADLGLIFDPAHKGPGLKIAEILKRGPADQRGLNLKPGDIITAIDGIELNDQVDTAKALNDKVGEAVSLSVTSGQPSPPGGGGKGGGEAKRRVEIQGASRTRVADLMYERWVNLNARRVAELSKGTLGYIHIPSMNEDGLDRFLRSLYSDNFDKEAIVLDVRFNGGGFTHDQVLNYLGAKEHTFFHQRGGPFGAVLRSDDRKWARPLVLLINNRSYSDAEIFPHAFRTLGLGKLVGQPTGGHVIGTRNIQLIDGSMFRTPRIGVSTLKGINMEKEGVQPDYFVDVSPDHLARGLDPQLEKAVEILQQDVAAWKKARGPVALNPFGNEPSNNPGIQAARSPNPTPTPPKKD